MPFLVQSWIALESLLYDTTMSYYFTDNVVATDKPARAEGRVWRTSTHTFTITHISGLCTPPTMQLSVGRAITAPLLFLMANRRWHAPPFFCSDHDHG